MAGAIRRVPAIADAPVTRMINGPEGFTPDNEFILGESDVRGLFVAAGFCAHGIAGAGGIGRQVASWIVDGRARARPVADGHPPVRAAVPQPLVHARAEHRELRDLLRHPLPERGAPGRAAAARVAGVRAAGGARGVVRREGVVGAGELVRAERRRRGRGDGRGPRGAPAARLGGRALEPGDRRRGAGDADDGRRCSTRRRSRRSRSSGRARRRCCSGCAPTTSTGRSAASPTPSC